MKPKIKLKQPYLYQINRIYLNSEKRQARALYNKGFSSGSGNDSYATLYAPSIRAPKNIKQILIYLNIELDSSKIIVGDKACHFQEWTDHLERKSAQQKQS